MITKSVTTVMTFGLLSLAGVGVAMADETTEELLDKAKEHITLSGAVEVEIGWSEDFEGATESDIALATATLGVEASLVDWASATAVFDWDDEEDKVTVDEAFLVLGNTDKMPVFLQAGRFYLPFGVFETNTVSDPLTLEAFETREDAVMIGYGLAGIEMGAYGFNGDTNEGGGDDTIEHFGAYVGYSLENETVKVNAHLGYLSSVIDSDTLSESFDLEADYVGGIALQADVEFAGVMLIGEYISAVEDYASFEGENRQPSAFHVEVGYGFDLGLPLLVAVSYSGTEDLGGVLPESRLAAVAGIDLTEGLSAKVEYAHDVDYDVEEGGSGEDADAVTIQLAYEF